MEAKEADCNGVRLGAMLEQVGDTALHIAAMSGHQGVVERLIAAKCNVDQQTPVRAPEGRPRQS
eukprot:345073-Rhodomonas_salina.4